MCFSAQILQRMNELRYYGVHIDYAQAEQWFYRRLRESKIKITKGFEANFDVPANEDERRIKALIDEYRAQQTTILEMELFKQKKRLGDAQRKMSKCEALGKPATKKALEDFRIATDKLTDIPRKLNDLRRTELLPRDDRIFPFVFAPVIMMKDGRKTLELARYHCRQAGKPTLYDQKFPGLYNARRDNIDRFWRKEFGQTHALMIVNSFYENVDREGKNVELHFQPQPPRPMLVACLYSRWSDPKEGDLLSFAAITDEPPAEVLAAGHDRCIVNLKPENVNAWLTPEGRTDDELQGILEDKERPFYEHEVLAA